MPRTTYTEEEVSAIIRVAYATGARDAVIAMQGTPLSEEQEMLLRPIVTNRAGLKDTRNDILRVACALAFQEVRGRDW